MLICILLHRYLNNITIYPQRRNLLFMKTHFILTKDICYLYIKQLGNIVAIAAFLLFLNNCAAVAIGTVAVAAGTTTAVVVTDPRASKIIIDDNTIANKLQAKLNTNNFPNSNIAVSCYDGNILLTGQIRNQTDKIDVIFNAKTIPGVKQIYNYLDIRLPQSLMSRTNDSYITTEVKAKLIGADNIKSNSIKVVTTNSVVYLLGVVNQKDAIIIANIAANINGVNKVITLFEYK